MKKIFFLTLILFACRGHEDVPQEIKLNIKEQQLLNILDRAEYHAEKGNIQKACYIYKILTEKTPADFTFVKQLAHYALKNLVDENFTTAQDIALLKLEPDHASFDF